MSDFLQQIKSPEFLNEELGNQRVKRIADFYDKAMAATVGLDFTRHVEAGFHDDVAYDINSGDARVPFVILNVNRVEPEVFGLVVGYVFPGHIYQTLKEQCHAFFEEMKAQPFIKVNLQVMENHDHVLTMYAEGVADPSAQFEQDSQSIRYAARTIEYMFRRYNDFHKKVTMILRAYNQA